MYVLSQPSLSSAITASDMVADQPADNVPGGELSAFKKWKSVFQKVENNKTL